MTGDIANGVYTFDRGVLVFIDNNVATRVQLNSGDIDVQILNFRGTANGPQEFVDLQLRTIMADQLDQTILALAITDELDLLEARVVTVEVDTSSIVAVGHGLLDHGVEFAQEVLATNEHVSLNIRSVHNTSQLDSDITSSNNGNLRRKVFQLEEAITGDTVLGTGNLRNVGATTGSNQDVRRSKARNTAIFIGDFDDLGLDETSTAVDKINAFATPVALIDTIQSLDDGVAGVLEVGVIKLDFLGDVVAVVLADLEHFVDGREIPGHLLGNTSRYSGQHGYSDSNSAIAGEAIFVIRNLPNVNTGTAGPAALDNQSLCAVPAGCAASATTTAATTTQDNVVILLNVDGGHC